MIDGEAVSDYYGRQEHEAAARCTLGASPLESGNAREATCLIAGRRAHSASGTQHGQLGADAGSTPALPTDYPAWICADCGTRLGRMPEGHISTWHRGTCGWCRQERDVTEQRDYGYPPVKRAPWIAR